MFLKSLAQAARYMATVVAYATLEPRRFASAKPVASPPSANVLMRLDKRAPTLAILVGWTSAKLVACRIAV